MIGAVLDVWTVYDRPLDFPNGFIARKFQILRSRPEPVPTEDTMRASSIEPLREQLRGMGLTRLSPNAGDEPQIVELWV